jgi:hypothetical protein
MDFGRTSTCPSSRPIIGIDLSPGESVHTSNGFDTWMAFRSGAVGLLLVAVVVGCSTTSPKLGNRGAGSTSSEAAAQTLGPGLHRVGTDVVPGVYERDGGQACAAARMSAMVEPLDVSGRFSPNAQTLGLVPSSFDAGHLAIEVEATDTAFYVFRCGGWHIATGPARTSFGPGIWVVGKDIESGRYQGQNAPDLSCQWIRLSGLKAGADFETIERSPVLVSDERPVVEIQPTDVAFLQSNGGTFTKIN